MLPYTPMHHLLLAGPPMPRHDERQPERGTHCHKRTTKPCESCRYWRISILTHDRDIFMRVDDSVVRIFEDAPRVVRRARGYAPQAIRLAQECPDVIAAGGELKNTFCLTGAGMRSKPAYRQSGEHRNAGVLRRDSAQSAECLRRRAGCDCARSASRLHEYPLGARTWRRRRSRCSTITRTSQAAWRKTGVGERVIGVAFDGTGLRHGRADVGWRVSGVRLQAGSSARRI